VREIDVTLTNGKKVDRLNELEYIDNAIWANVWYKDVIEIIDPKNGKILSEVHFSSSEEKMNGGDVLNGIAFDLETRKLYITGKYWKNIYEVTLFVPNN